MVDLFIEAETIRSRKGTKVILVQIATCRKYISDITK